MRRSQQDKLRAASRPIKKIYCSYYYAGGYTNFRVTMDEQIRWNAFCIKLDWEGRKPSREDYIRFTQNNK